MRSANVADGKDSVQSLADQIAADGFVFVEKLCETSFVAKILDIGQHRADEVRAALGNRDIGIGSAAGFEEIVQRSPGRWDVPVSPSQFGFDARNAPWWRLVAAVLGDDAEHSFSGVVFSDPGSPAQHWHTDSPHLAREHLAAHAVNVLVALQDIPLVMGPTECARGTHVLTNHLKNPLLVRDELIYQHAGTSPELLVQDTQRSAPERVAKEMTTGSCLVFDDRLMHRGLANRSDHSRHVAYFSYRRADYSENTHFESRRSVFDSGRS